MCKTKGRMNIKKGKLKNLISEYEMNLSNNNNKNEVFEKCYLYWENQFTQKRHSAGIAFFHKEKCYYNIKIDLFAKKHLQLRSIWATDNVIRYRLEVVRRPPNNKQEMRHLVGEGVSLKINGFNEIAVDIPPFEQKLVLVMPKTANAVKGVA